MKEDFHGIKLLLQRVYVNFFYLNLKLLKIKCVCILYHVYALSTTAHNLLYEHLARNH